MLARQRLVWAASATVLATLALAQAARAADHTWSGAGVALSPAWSNAANWSAGGAPSPGETIGTLTFPALTCAPGANCAASFNDVAGLTVGTLAIADSSASDPTQTYSMTGDGITLTGGVSASPGPAPGPSGAFPVIGVPIALGAAQTWTVAGGPPLVGGQPNLDGLTLSAPITGPGAALTVHLSDSADLGLTGDNEVGPVSITGTATSGQPGPFGSGVVSIGSPAAASALNAGDGNAVAISGITLAVDGALGPLTATGSDLVVGTTFMPAGGATAASVALDGSSYVQVNVAGNGATAGTDYSQLRSTGAVALGGAHLVLATVGGPPSAACPPPALGTVYTLVSTTGSLTGRFDVEDGGVVPVGGPVTGCPPAFAVRIDYHETGSPQTVTATVVPAPPPGVAPGVGGAAPVSGVVLVRQPGRHAFVRLRAGTLIPSGAELETQRGRVQIYAAADLRGGIESAQLHGGRFVFRQRRAAAPVFALSAPLTGCGRRAAAASHKPRRRRRYVWVTEQGGHFNTRAKLVSTSVQGTSWLTEDTCATSRVLVKSGTVRVRDRVRRRTIRLHAGQSYTARRR
jgi:hypothetical protein